MVKTTRPIYYVFDVISLESRPLIFEYLHTRTYKSSNTIYKVNILKNTRPLLKQGVKNFREEILSHVEVSDGRGIIKLNRLLISHLNSKHARLNAIKSVLVFCFSRARQKGSWFQAFLAETVETRDKNRNVSQQHVFILRRKLRKD